METSRVDTKRVVFVGGHSRIARLATPKFIAAGYESRNIVRAPAQTAEIQRLGGTSVLMDLETASVSDFIAAFDGATAVVFSARAGVGDDALTEAVDRVAAIRSIDAAKEAGVGRYVMVSSVAAARAESLDPDDASAAHARAKLAADEHLRSSGLDYTILRPGPLIDDPSDGKITIADDDGLVDGAEPASPDTSRTNVAEAVVHVVATDAAVGEVVAFYDGETPIAEALG